MKNQRIDYQNESSHGPPGILSACLRKIRYQVASQVVHPNASFLDIGCNQMDVVKYLGPIKKYTGLDYLPPLKFIDYQAENIEYIQIKIAPEQLIKLKLRVDYILCLAFLEHVPKPGLYIGAMRKLLKPGGKIVITTPHQRGRILHELGARLGVFSWSAAKEHQKFLVERDFHEIARKQHLKLEIYQTFLLGFNQLVVFSL